ncbi:SWIM zinc finger family protein [Thalassoglobus polymorphus]|uniref:SWIM zinc finger protein n=1 Tax=Thalassoglobus polymorphus TaxID=2527994 RepID=A0A517QMX7_9PLAN|nr:SWIM zinc finger family protein [Thalassoglobus polymorphus]QDT33000.1 SWIM zinc finger protein [Thalassoglobus polymorphus]
MQLSLEQVREMAPDEKSVIAANKIVSLNHWNSPGLSDVAIWGKCAGGRYQVRVDLQNLGSHCNCPSRKFPCKHVLALLMLFTSTPDAFEITDSPEWVADWIQKRRQREQQKSAGKVQPSKPVDPEAQAKRIRERESRIAEGLQHLIVWMDDLIRNGVAGLEAQPFHFWDTQARRLVDAQAKGLASRIYRLAEIPNSSRDWPERLTNELGRTRLLVHAYLNQGELSPSLQADVRQLIGWTVSQADLQASGTEIEDDWFIFGQRVEDEDRFTTQRSWAVGRKTQQEALFLQFAPGKQGFSESIVPGTCISGKLVFYPATVLQRAKISERSEEQHVSAMDLFYLDSIEDFLDSYADRLGRNPWLASCSCLLKEVSIAQHKGDWYLRDKHGYGVPFKSLETYRILAMTGGQPVHVMGEWNGNFFSPWSLLVNQQFRICS